MKINEKFQSLSIISRLKYNVCLVNDVQELFDGYYKTYKVEGYDLYKRKDKDFLCSTRQYVIV